MLKRSKCERLSALDRIGGLSAKEEGSVLVMSKSFSCSGLNPREIERVPGASH